MLRPVVVHVAPLADRYEVHVPVVGGVVVAVAGRQDHPRRPYGSENVVLSNRKADGLPLPVAPGTDLRVPPAAIAKVPDGFPMRSPAALTAALGASKADHRRQLRPVDGVEEAVLAPDRHGGTEAWRLDRLSHGAQSLATDEGSPVVAGRRAGATLREVECCRDNASDHTSPCRSAL